MIYLDTHVVVWLYGGLVAEFSPTASAAIEGNELLISPMVRLELRYLHETGRITVPPAKVIGALERDLGLAICPQPFSLVVRQAEQVGWTRDPFDRLIVGQAEAGAFPLLTRDELIRKHFANAIW
jgi:PIN domain nuclease of toxin-antitoxin system